MVARALAVHLIAAQDRPSRFREHVAAKGVIAVNALHARLAMLTAAVMLAHLWAAKAVRSAVFLSAWDATNLPAMVFVTSVVVIATVPLYARLLASVGPATVVPTGLLFSACAHVIEWRLDTENPWVAAGIFLHVAGLGSLLLSGFWSLINEVFDPQAARHRFGGIAAAGTIGGLLGGLAIDRLSATHPDGALLLLGGFHLTAAVGAMSLGFGVPVTPVSRHSSDAGSVFDLAGLRASPHLKTLAVIVTLSAASAFVIEYLFQAGAQAEFTERSELQQFLARFYIVVGVATAAVQIAAGPAVRHLGLGRTISSLSTGLGASGALALIFQTFPMVIVVRAVEATLRGSLFRSGYELLFVPMDPEEKRRTKTFLDVACDRAGDALGAAVVQLILIAAGQLALGAFLSPMLLAIIVVMAAFGLWVGRRLDRLYLGVVERRLAKEAEHTPLVVQSDVGWTVIGMTVPHGVERTQTVTTVPLTPSGWEDDPRLLSLSELRSGSRARVKAALAKIESPDRMQFAQVASLLAWDDVMPHARAVLERHATKHIGLLVDALVDPSTEFAVRRRLPRVLGMLDSPRAIEGLLWALEDSRFEVRYQSARAIARLLRNHPHLTVDAAQILKAVDRELSVPLTVWQGHRLIDRAEGDDEGSDPAVPPEPADERETPDASRNLEHVFTLFATVFPRDAVLTARRGLESADPRLRALAVEYLDSALPPALRGKLWALVGVPT
jgi:hypothetical protein